MDLILPQYMSAFAGETFTVSTTALGFTPATFRPGSGPEAGITAQVAVVTVTAQPISIRFDGTVATAGNGLVVPAGSSIVIYGPGEIGRASFIRQGATDATLEVQYFG